ncbi:MAG: uncharacterized protein KVP18_002035 [Porospora cf. gigantea A]|uniref:uncharacterized protein n=1 Tax=Porospora cf. gigantea A TaxID=2853593 RepID=UPI00355A629F|nr:MAG: hypothetical protein KVP18_002035 [Porospora cf. gigantea A]
MKPETKLLLATAGVDIGMGALGLGLFLTLRVLRNDCYRPGFQLLRSDSLASPLVPRSGRLSYDSVRSFDTLRSIGRKSRWFGWAVDIWRVDVQTFQSSDVRHYLNFLRSMAILFARIAVLSLCVVLPVNLSGTGGGASIVGCHVGVNAVPAPADHAR